MAHPVLHRLTTEGFRLFFLAAAGFAVLAMALWLVALAGTWAATAQWHAHEMIFGFGLAAAAGFLLTAEGRRGSVALAGAVWLAGRLAMLAAPWLPPVVVAVVDLAFLPVLGLLLAPMVPRLAGPLRLAFLAGPALLWAGNLACHLEWMGLAFGNASAGLRAALVAQAATILVDGGRLVPGFTRNAMVQAGQTESLPRDPARLAGLALLPAFALAAAVLAGAPQAVLAGLALLAGAAALARLALWRPGWTRRQPLLWALHLAWALNVAGLVALGLFHAGLGLPEAAGLHLIGIGGMGGVTLAIMVRAALGRTGRPALAPRGMALAFAALALSALLRAGADLGGPMLAQAGIHASGGLWLLGFGLYLLRMGPVLRDPRVPRAPITWAPKLPGRPE